MKKLFTFLSRANNNSVGIHLFNQHRVSSIYSMLTLVAIMLMAPQGAKARQFVYDFRSLAKAAYEQSGYSNQGFYDINMGGAYSGVSGLVANYGASTTYGNVTVDFSKFAFRMNISETKGWLLYTTDYNADLAGLTYRGTEPRFVITNLRPDDEITIYCKASRYDRTVNITFASGNAKWSNGNKIDDNTTLINYSGSTNEQQITFKASENGDIVLTTTSAAWHIILTGVVINRPDRASYNYDPAIENYDLSSLNNGSASASSTKADYQLGDQDAYYLSNPSGYSLSKRIAVQSNVNNLSWNNGLKNSENNSWDFKYISISNLKADDRIRITFEGDAIFASAPNNVFNSSVFLDVDNDGLQDSQEDVTITGGTGVQSGSWYTMLEDGHLDFILMGGATIKKIEIYCDHQARMVDRYGNATQGNTSYFDTTGQLEAKHHIVPGGLHVYIGGDAATEHAEVVYSDEGPVSYVYDYAHYKPARHATWGSFTYSAELPVTGTFYRFIPDVDGKMTVRFKTYSVNYTDWGSDGNIEGYERQVTTVCPYYLALKNGNVPSSPLQSTTKGTGETVTFTYNLTAGNVYYLYGWWPDGTDGNNFGQRGCGIAELIDVTFAADNYVYPLAKWVASGTTEDEELATITGYSIVTVKKKSDNIKSCTPYIDGTTLKIKDIEFNDESKGGGTILIKVGDPYNDADPVFAYTIAYDAAYNTQTIGKDADGNVVTRSEGHTWDFSTNSLHGLKWEGDRNNNEATVKDFGTRFNGYSYDPANLDENGIPNSGINNNSFLTEEYNKGDWTFNYRVKKNGKFHDPRFLNNWDMVGDNADMMWDTEGLIFNTPSSLSCIFNEYGSVADHSSETDPDRYVGILPGGSFTIPKLKAGDRVLIYMGSGNGSSSDACKFNITGALDAIGQAIVPSDIYNGGGSEWTYSGDTYYYHGAYQFISTGGDMTFTMNGGSMTKLYSITIYHGVKSGSTDATRVKSQTYNDETYNANAWWLYNDYRTETAQRAAYSLHFRGKGQRQKTPVVLYKSGNVNTDANHLMYVELGNTKAPYILFKSEKEQYGMFRMRIEDYELNNKYVADYGLQNVAVGYLQNKNYPYTWDFTDLKGYAETSTRIQKEREKVEAYAPKTVTGNYDIEFMNYTVGDGVKSIEQWKEYAAEGDIPAGYGLHLRNEPYNGGVMWESGQLYAGNEIFDETFGLSISAPGVHQDYNGGLRISDDEGKEGLCLTGGNWKITIPEVDTSYAIYVRATPIGDVTAGVGAADSDFTYVGTASDGTGDNIYAVKGTGADMALFFNNVIIKKIAISHDPKTVNKLGYATESRNVEIDPELMGYMTGTGLKAYTVTKVVYGDKAGDIPSITLTEIPKANVMGKATSGDKRGYIIYNTDDTKAVNILDGGFHLFVPDMHDDTEGSDPKKEKLDVTGNHLKSNITSSSIPQTSGDYTNYLMNYKYTGNDGKQHEGPEAFYRAGVGATLGNNKAYLQLLTEKVKPTNYNGVNPAKFAIIFEDEFNCINPGITTVIEDASQLMDNNAEWYNLNGQKLNGKPSTNGLYIVNGKKVLVK